MLLKNTDTVLMALGRKGLTSGAIKGLTVCRFTSDCVLHCKHTALHGCFFSAEQCVGNRQAAELH
ncbi:unnamed protein product [Staurois parvus]|uniref:Uncharacterized protein n=1 Tax=Staurois parvus TaxID=386267 RepID=A0ABN9B933_9NEOB|nr:unnamed protein product [Staurois parvus]